MRDGSVEKREGIGEREREWGKWETKCGRNIEGIGKRRKTASGLGGAKKMSGEKERKKGGRRNETQLWQAIKKVILMALINCHASVFPCESHDSSRSI